MTKDLDLVKSAFDKALGPFRKRQKIVADLKEPDVAKDRRSQLAKEASDLETQWVEALKELRKAMDACPLTRGEQTS